jgi:hypothetical protein
LHFPWLVPNIPHHEVFAMPLITVTTPTPHEPFEVRIGNGAHLYTVVPNVIVTQFVYAEHLAALTTAIQAAVPGAVVTSRPE